MNGCEMFHKSVSYLEARGMGRHHTKGAKQNKILEIPEVRVLPHPFSNLTALLTK